MESKYIYSWRKSRNKTCALNCWINLSGWEPWNKEVYQISWGIKNISWQPRSHCVGCRIALFGNKNSFFFFFFQVRMMDVEKCGSRDMKSEKQNGKNISRNWKLKSKQKVKVITGRKLSAIFSLYCIEWWLLELLISLCLTTLINNSHSQRFKDGPLGR